MGATVTISDDDKLYRKILREVAKLRRATITVGIHGSAGMHADSDETVAQIGATHEFGAGHVPERSFLRSTVDGNPKPMMSLQKAAGDVCRGELTARQACEQVGLVTVGAVKETILHKIAPPLSPMTIAKRKKKGAHGGGLASKADATTPLVDSGQLINSITHQVTGGAGWGSASAGTKTAIGGAA